MTATLPHSPGLWMLAWRRLRADRLAMASLAVVAAYLVMIALSGSGLIAADWDREVGVNYAPPSFVGAVQQAGKSGIAIEERDVPENPLDPLKDVLRELRAQRGDVQPAVVQDYGIVDPIGPEIAQLRAQLAKEGRGASAERTAALPFGADKWGHDIVKKTVKGSETSIVVGLLAALLATLLGTVLGAMAGYFGSVADDILNWVYSVFTAVPNLLLIMAVAAVLQHKGVATIVLILALTGWTGTFRLVRAEYIKHKSREYVLAAGAIGASHWRRMFSHIFPNVSHVALVQMSVLSVGFIKYEVILSFLGFGVPVGVVSWGS
ncbi:MAG: ABC transporter permease, partial [Burkholderiaceae bacterium]|nr:ABC transporter permease [Burkholderiaceae bacterium]